jgi:hypothetical protein
VEPWSIGLVALIVIGLGVIIFGALHDRARNRRRAAEMLAPPPRAIPRLERDAPAPAYVSELQARRAPGGAGRDLSPGDRAAVDAEIEAASTVTINTGYASRDFVTDAPTSRAVLDHPLVAVCAGPVQSVRELLPILERASRSHRPLVLLAASFTPEITATLEVNAIQRTIALVAVVAGTADAEAVARATHAVIIDAADRRSGYLAPNQLGSCARWISTATASHLILPADHHQTA